MELQIMPEEILIEIFKYMDYKIELPEIKLVCERFKEIIEGMMNNRERVKIDGTIENRDFIINNKKAIIKVLNRDYNFFHKEILPHIEIFLKDLSITGSIWHRSVDIKLFKDALLACPNLKNLNVSANFSRYDEIVFNEPSIKLNLNSLEYWSDHEYFKLFINCTTNSLKLVRFNNHGASCHNYKSFLKKQVNLNELELIFEGDNFPLFDDEQLHRVDFKLKKMTIHSESIPDVQAINFQEFVSNHKNTLKILNIHKCRNILDCFAKFTSLKKMTVSQIDISPEPFESVESLNIFFIYGNEQLSHIVAKFPNVKHLILNAEKFDLRGLRHLESLVISGKDLRYAEIPVVKNLKIKNAKYITSELVSHEVQNLTLEKCDEVLFLNNFLDHPSIQLNSLKILDSSIMKKSQKSIQRNKHKIKNFALNMTSIYSKMIIEEDDFIYDIIIDGDDIEDPENFQFPDVRRLKLTCLQEISSDSNFVNNGDSIELLTFYGCCCIDWLDDFFKKKSTRLIALRFIDCEMSSCELRMIEENRRKIKNLVIENCTDPCYEYKEGYENIKDVLEGGTEFFDGNDRIRYKHHDMMYFYWGIVDTFE